MATSKTYYKMVSMSGVDKDVSKGQYQTKEVEKHDRRNDPSVKFAKQSLLFLWVDVDGILNSTVLLLVCDILRVRSGLFHLQIHREWISLYGNE